VVRAIGRSRSNDVVTEAKRSHEDLEATVRACTRLVSAAIEGWRRRSKERAYRGISGRHAVGEELLLG